MSEVFSWPESECARALGLLAQHVDGDLAAEESAWLGGHLEACAACRAALAGLAKMDHELTGWGQSLDRRSPPPPGAREQLAAGLGSLPARRRAMRWMPAVAGLIAAAVALAVIRPHPQPPSGNREAPPFIRIPYLPPLDPHENATIVRMNIRVATLIGVGYRITADPDAMVAADVLVGEDGRAHAVRVLADIDLKGTGD